ncbi:MAG: hypothetical protein JWO60_2315 [Frankiales bacterium]|nr:hypothetical protein [Frankiales bacterium]
MGVFCLDRAGWPVFGTSNRLWALTGDVLRALGAERADTAWTRDGYVPSWLARSWGDCLFADLGDAVLVCRPLPGRSDLSPVGTYRRGSSAAAGWTRAGEHLSVYDTPVATVLLSFAQACTATAGFAVTTLRPPAPGSPRSAAAARVLLVRSGMLPARPPLGPGRLRPLPTPSRRRTS